MGMGAKEKGVSKGFCDIWAGIWSWESLNEGWILKLNGLPVKARSGKGGIHVAHGGKLRMLISAGASALAKTGCPQG